MLDVGLFSDCSDQQRRGGVMEEEEEAEGQAERQTAGGRCDPFMSDVCFHDNQLSVIWLQPFEVS